VKSEAIQPLLHRNESSSSGSSHRSGLVDLVVEDRRAEETARVRARKEGGPGWNEAEPKRYVRQYPPEVAGEEIREGFEPPTTPPVDAPQPLHATQGDPENPQFSVGDEEDDKNDLPEDHKDGSPWRSDGEDGGEDGGEDIREDSSRDISGIYGSMDERNVWDSH